MTLFLIIVAGAGVLVGGFIGLLGVALFVGLIVDIATKFETTGIGTDEEVTQEGGQLFKPNNVLHVTSIRIFSN